MTVFYIIAILTLAAGFTISLAYISFYRRKSAAVIFGLMQEITALNSLTGSCQITYNKTGKEKQRNYAFDFGGIGEFNEKMKRYSGTNPDRIIIFLNPKNYA